MRECNRVPADFGGAFAHGGFVMRLSLLLTASLSTISLALATAQPALAQTPYHLDAIIISGGLSPVPRAAFGRSVSVLTADELRDRQIDQVTDALRALPGVAVNRTGGPGGLTQVRLRGTEGRHVQVILDGVRLDPPQNGEFDFAGLQVADIERIEVLRGPQSTFFGSNTIGGVISITTRRAIQPSFSGEAGLEAGSDRTIGGNLALNWRGNRGGLRFSAVGRNEGGFDISRTPGGERDGMDNRTLMLSGDYEMGEAVRLGFMLRQRHQTNHYDPQRYDQGPISEIVFDRNDYRRLQERLGSVFAEADVMDGRLRLLARASRFEIDNQRYTDGIQGSDDSAGRTEISLRATLALDTDHVDSARHSLGLGIDRQRESFRNNDPAFTYDPSQMIPQSRSLTGVALEYRGQLAAGLDLQLGLRRDLNDRFSDFTTYSAALSWSLPESGTRLHGSIGTGVQNPSLFQQFGFVPDAFEGNPDLVPEQSRGWDIGVEQALWDGRALASAVYFDNRLTNRIISTPGSAPGISRPDNASGVSRRRGVELGLEADLTDRLMMRASYTFTDARGEAGEQLVRRPRHELGLNLNYAAGDRTTLTLDARGVAGNHDLDFRGNAFTDTPVVRLADYAVVHLAASYRLNDRADLTARINNVFNRDYYEVLGYGTQGRTLYLGVQSRF